MEFFAITLIFIALMSFSLAIGYLISGKHEHPLIRIHGVSSAVTVDFLNFERAGENATHVKEVISDAIAEEKKNGEHAHYKWKTAARHVEHLPKNLGKNTAHIIHTHIEDLKHHNSFWADMHPKRRN